MRRRKQSSLSGARRGEQGAEEEGEEENDTGKRKIKGEDVKEWIRVRGESLNNKEK